MSSQAMSEGTQQVERKTDLTVNGVNVGLVKGDQYIRFTKVAQETRWCYSSFAKLENVAGNPLIQPLDDQYIGNFKKNQSYISFTMWGRPYLLELSQLPYVVQGLEAPPFNTVFVELVTI